MGQKLELTVAWYCRPLREGRKGWRSSSSVATRAAATVGENNGRFLWRNSQDDMIFLKIFIRQTCCSPHMSMSTDWIGLDCTTMFPVRSDISITCRQGKLPCGLCFIHLHQRKDEMRKTFSMFEWLIPSAPKGSIHSNKFTIRWGGETVLTSHDTGLCKFSLYISVFFCYQFLHLMGMQVQILEQPRA
jgi:hypothetical protein